MHLLNLTENPTTYTCNVYYLKSEFSSVPSNNTIIDIGRDEIIFENFSNIEVNPGRKLIDQIIITHNHYDHTALLEIVKKEYSPVVYGFSPFIKGVDVILKGGESLLIADKYFEVIHTPGHTQDSVCLYCKDNGYLFVGDTPVIVNPGEWTFEENYVRAMEYLCRKDVSKIFFGHGPPLENNCNERLKKTLKVIMNSNIKPGSQ
ncbi:MBL fold metallo-hydrolase [Methanoplanus limicola]|uniref:Beta-lactamase domain-containing protein n=1 Tax=Methanoplanus limicola DSM 2279 TaxID=937775 RepID=H1YX90_9EURY|nr:MBL fold metallo-hydrolase [Methanoplanus limicola]EHQ35893.1 beta-lactamase domain-containing protein [Methanoplanus limicola DSM 2279]